MCVCVASSTLMGSPRIIHHHDTAILSPVISLSCVAIRATTRRGTRLTSHVCLCVCVCITQFCCRYPDSACNNYMCTCQLLDWVPGLHTIDNLRSPPLLCSLCMSHFCFLCVCTYATISRTVICFLIMCCQLSHGGIIYIKKKLLMCRKFPVMSARCHAVYKVW